MHEDDEEKEARSFTDDQQEMFGASEAYQAGTPVRPRTPGADAPADPLTELEPVPPPEASAAAEEEPRLEVVARRGVSGADVTGGTDKYGPGGMADQEHHTHEGTGARETGDLTGATSTHAGAGGEFDQTGGTGTAPNTVGQTEEE